MMMVRRGKRRRLLRVVVVVDVEHVLLIQHALRHRERQQRSKSGIITSVVASKLLRRWRRRKPITRSNIFGFRKVVRKPPIKVNPSKLHLRRRDHHRRKLIRIFNHATQKRRQLTPHNRRRPSTEYRLPFLHSQPTFVKRRGKNRLESHDILLPFLLPPRSGVAGKGRHSCSGASEGGRGRGTWTSSILQHRPRLQTLPPLLVVVGAPQALCCCRCSFFGPLALHQFPGYLLHPRTQQNPKNKISISVYVSNRCILHPPFLMLLSLWKELVFALWKDLNFLVFQLFLLLQIFRKKKKKKKKKSSKQGPSPSTNAASIHRERPN